MKGLIVALVFVLSLNMFFFFEQQAVNDINPGGTQFFTYAGSHIGGFDQGNYTLPSDPTSAIPVTTTSVSPTTGNIFTDAWSATTNWLLNTTGISYLIAIVNTVPNFLKALGLPAAFAFGVGYLWYAFSVMIVILFIRGIVE